MSVVRRAGGQHGPVPLPTTHPTACTPAKPMWGMPHIPQAQAGHMPKVSAETARGMCVLLSQPRFKKALVSLTQDFSGNII